LFSAVKWQSAGREAIRKKEKERAHALEVDVISEGGGGFLLRLELCLASLGEQADEANRKMTIILA
jgi:hypothetical protein